MKRKIVIKVQMNSDRSRSKAMALVAATGGVNSVALDSEARDKIVAVGEGVDPIELTRALRKKVGAAELLQVGDTNPPAAAVPSIPPPQSGTIVHCYHHPAGYSWHSMSA